MTARCGRPRRLSTIRDERPICAVRAPAYHARMRAPRLNHIDMLRLVGLFTYACVGTPLLLETWGAIEPASAEQHSAYLGWALSYATFGLSYWWITHDLQRWVSQPQRLLLLVVLSVSAIAVGHYSRSGLSGILLMVISGVLPWMLPPWVAALWLAAETLALVPVFANLPNWTWLQAGFQAFMYVGVAAFTFVTSLVAKGQAAAREEQRRLNAELRATRALLAESTRLGERVRISRELHDLLGHHLTALSLNLEVASHLAQGQAQEHVRQAQALAKLLLADVREVVSQLRADDEIDLGRALAQLVEGIPEPAIHIELPDDFDLDDPRRAQVLLRCAQEVITNTIRHARARNLWLRFARDAAGAWRLHARDDGQGVEHLAQGNGLTGMRERLAQVGGGLTIDTAKGRGFALEAWIPRGATS